MKQAGEKVLLYQFSTEREEQVKTVMRELTIPVHTLQEDAFSQKVGYLLGLKGFVPTSVDEKETFDFPHEVMVMYNIKNKRLDQVLTALKENAISIPYKAVVTPFNLLWTLKRLCRTMEKEHAFIVAQQGKTVSLKKE